MSSWKIKERPIVPDEFAQLVGGHPLVAETLVRRGITRIQDAWAFLDPARYRPASPYDLPGMARAVQRILAAISNKEKICIWGDFDVDGQTSTTLLLETLTALQANVTYHIPIRKEESHGINIPVLTKVIDEGANLILSCDTGISGNDAVAYAASRGVDVIITDHHALPKTLPDAFAIVNSQLVAREHPLRTLPGVGVAYKLAEALLEEAGMPEKTEDLLDLVALGIVADVALIQKDTRYLLQLGLRKLQNTKRLGLQQLYEYADVTPEHLTEETISFSLAPRLNSIGRMDDASVIPEFLLTDDLGKARITAARLEQLNAERKIETDQIYRGAEDLILRDSSLLHHGALVLVSSNWRAGIVGIVASRLVEKYNRPVVMLTTSNGTASGSARSVDGVDITHAISMHADLLNNFGGHPMAAGLGIDEEKIPRFREKLGKTVQVLLEEVDVEPVQEIDAVITLPDITLGFVEEIERLAPFGAGNPQLVFGAKDLVIRNPRAIGKNKEHLRLVVADRQENVQEVLWWRAGESDIQSESLGLSFTLASSSFRGERQVQVTWKDALWHTEVEVLKEKKQARQIEFVDYRGADNPMSVLEKLQETEDIQVFAEGVSNIPSAGSDRFSLLEAPCLALWSFPPNPETYKAIIRTVNPGTIYVFGADKEKFSFKSFIETLAGLLKFSLRKYQGKISTQLLIAKTGATKALIKNGLDFLKQEGVFEVEYIKNDELQIHDGKHITANISDKISVNIQRGLQELHAYREYLLSLEIGGFIDE